MDECDTSFKADKGWHKPMLFRKKLTRLNFTSKHRILGYENIGISECEICIAGKGIFTTQGECENSSFKNLDGKILSLTPTGDLKLHSVEVCTVEKFVAEDSVRCSQKIV